MYRLYCRKFIETNGGKTVDQIASSLVLDWVAKHYGQQSGSAQFNAARSIARKFRWANDERQIPEYPLRGFRKPTASRRETFVSPQQYAALLRACVKSKVIDGVSTTVQHRCIRDAIKFLYHTGCRPQAINCRRV